MDGGTKLKKLLLALLLGLATPALAGNGFTPVGNTNYTMLATDSQLVPTVALTANRTWTLPPAAATCVGGAGPYFGQGTCATALQIIDSQGNVGGTNSCILVVPSAGDNLNGGSNTVTFCNSFGRAIFRPMGGTNWQLDTGELQTTGFCVASGTTNTVTFTTATPTVVTDTGATFTGACPLTFTSTAQLPTGVASGATPSG